MSDNPKPNSPRNSQIEETNPASQESPPYAEKPFEIGGLAQDLQDSQGGQNEIVGNEKVLHFPSGGAEKAETLKKEGKTPLRILILRAAMVIMLILLAALLGYYVYKISNDSQMSQFQTTLSSAGTQLDGGLQINIISKISATTSAGIFLRYGLDGGASSSNQTTNYAFFSGFEEFGVEQAALTSVRAVNYGPIINPATRPAFEAYARNNVALLGGTLKVLTPNVQGGIFQKVNGVNIPYPANATNPFFVPVCQIAPILSNQAVIMYDLYSEANRKAAIDIALQTKLPATTDIIQLVQDTAINVFRASSLVVNPIYTLQDVNKTTPIAISSAVFSWDDIIRQSLPRGASIALWVLLTSSGNRKYTFYIQDGQITNVGSGDQTVGNVPDHLRSYSHTSVFSVGLVWTVTIYPAQPLWDSFMTTLPRDLCIAVVAGIVAVTLVYALYDFLTSGRSRALDHIARAANRMLEDVRLVSKPHDFSEELKEINAIHQSAGLLDIKAVPPRELDRSSIRTLELLGTGAFGRVYKALLQEKSLPGSPSYLTAVKSFAKPSDFEMRQIFLEAVTMNQIKHEHVVSFVGVVTKDRPVYLVVEFCEHGSLDTVLRGQRQLFNSSRLLMAHDVASGMAALHKIGLVHRDLAARNVLVDSSFRCKVSDFGHARNVGEEEYYEATSGRIAVRWVAPECITNRKYSEKSDVWSFGVLMWEIWTNAAEPYGQWTNEQVWLEVSNGYRLPEPEGCPPHLHTLMRQCWAQDSHSRPTFAALRDLFINTLNGDTMALQRDLSVERSNPASNQASASWSIQSSAVGEIDVEKFRRHSSHYVVEDEAMRHQSSHYVVEDEAMRHQSSHYVVEDEAMRHQSSHDTTEDSLEKKAWQFLHCKEKLEEGASDNEDAVSDSSRYHDPGAQPGTVSAHKSGTPNAESTLHSEENMNRYKESVV